MNTSKDEALKKIISQYEDLIGLSGISYSIKERADGPHLIFYIYKTTERFFYFLNQLVEKLPEDNPFYGHIGLLRKTEKFSLNSPEVKSLQRSLSESLTVGRDSFRDEFFARYIDSGSGAENKIQADANNFVFGRRGAGKSSLLVYAMRMLEKQNNPYIWIDMQVYEKRGDNGVIVGVLTELLGQLKDLISDNDRISYEKLLKKLETFRNADEETKIQSIRELALDFKFLLRPIVTKHKKLVIFLDDIHVIKKNLQPNLLSALYSFSRGNKIFLKISAVQNFTKNYDSASRTGLDIPNDAQTISLDLNLTAPDRAGEHIESILNAYAIFSGIPSLRSLCDRGPITRLTWVAAGVPRDAINIFQQALTKSILMKSNKVSITSVNLAAGEAVEDKVRYLEIDSSGTHEEAMKLFEAIKTFCTKLKKTNAFLIKIDSSNENFQNVQKLIDLRLLHVLTKEITPDEAGVKYIALLLDYGSYTGIRLARSVGVFQTKLQALKYNDLRNLPKFNLNQFGTT